MAKKVDFMSGFNQATQNLPVSSFSEQERIKKNIRIIDELRRFIPALSDDELKQLESNIIEHGCKDPLSIWETTRGAIEAETQFPDEPAFVLVDGHNRYEICQRNGIDFKISAPLKFDSMEAAKDFMINHQLGRRNLNPEQISYFRGLRYISLKQDKGKYDREEHNGKIFHYDKNENSDLENNPENHNGKIFHYDKTTTAKELAKEFNVSEKTIRNDALFAKSVENLPSEIRAEVLQGKSNLTRAEIIELGSLESEKTKQKTNRVGEKPESSVKDKILGLLRRSTEKLNINECKELMSEIKLIVKDLEKKQSND